MKQGDLVKISDGGNQNRGTTRWLYGGAEQCWDDRNSLIPTDIPFGFGDIGMVLKKKKMVPGRYTDSYVKIITSQGIGWLFENCLEVLE